MPRTRAFVRVPRPLKSSSTVKNWWSRSGLESLTTKRLRFLPILGELRTYNRQLFNRDAWAGLIVAMLALPQGIAYALIAGLPPAHGAYAAIASMALGAIFSGTRHVSFGPSITVAVLLLSIFVRHEITPEERTEAMSILLVLTSLILVVAAWFGLAQLTRYISRSVTLGFIAAAGVLIFASQLKHVLGLRLPETGVFLDEVGALVAHLPETHWPSLLVGSITGGVYLIAILKARRLPAAALAVLGGTLTAWLLARGGFPTESLEDFVRTFRPTSASALDFSWAGVIGQAALATALITHLEVSMIGRSFSARAGAVYDAGQQAYGQGLAQLGNAFFSGMPASASLERTRILRRQHAASPLAGVMAALFCAALLLGTAPWMHHVPRAALAALAMMLATEVVSRHYLRVILRSSSEDAFVLIATIVAGLLFRLDVALYLGAGLSILFFLRKVGVPQMTEFGFNEQGQLAAVGESSDRRTPDISIVHVEGNLFFGAAEIFFEQARRVCEDPNLKVIILRMKNAHHLDATCALAIEDLLRFARESGRHIIVSGAHREIFRVFRNSGLLDLLGRENFFMHVPSNPTIATRNALKRAQFLLGTREANIRIFVDSNRTKPDAAPATPPPVEKGPA